MSAASRTWPGTPHGPDVSLEEVLWKIDSKASRSDRAPSGWAARFVPYLNASSIARVLDEWVGPFSWEDRYENVTRGGHDLVECTLTIHTPDGVAVSKRDVGAPPQGGAELGGKGAVSDAFKRAACLKWGVGRNVYTLPNVWLPVRVPDESQPNRCYPIDDIRPHLDAALKRAGIDAASIGRVEDPSPDVEPEPAKSRPGNTRRPQATPEGQAEGPLPAGSVDVWGQIVQRVEAGKVTKGKVLALSRKLAEPPPTKFETVPQALTTESLQTLLSLLAVAR